MLIKPKRMARKAQLGAVSAVLVPRHVPDMAAFVQAVSSTSNLENDKCVWIIACPKHFNPPTWTALNFHFASMISCANTMST